MNIKRTVKRFILNHVSEKKRAELIKKWNHVDMGENCEIYKGVSFGSEPYLISLGNNVRITSGVKFCTHDGGMWVIRNLKLNPQADVFGRITVGDNVHIGWDTIIMPNVKIGNNVIIGCGAVVTRDIPDNSVVAGVPARVLKSVDEYYAKNADKILPTKGMSGAEKRKVIESVLTLS